MRHLPGKGQVHHDHSVHARLLLRDLCAAPGLPNVSPKVSANSQSFSVRHIFIAIEGFFCVPVKVLATLDEGRPRRFLYNWLPQHFLLQISKTFSCASKNSFHVNVGERDNSGREPL